LKTFDHLPTDMDRFPTTCAGSMGEDVSLRYRNPIELGWGGAVKFDHDFVGRAALEKVAPVPRRRMVTLLWNPEDVMAVYTSQLGQGEVHMWMDPLHLGQHQGRNILYADRVLKDGRVAGVSSGRQDSYCFRAMPSLCYSERQAVK
jgi:glycine cleavage system aminomethyltransferase T